MPVEAAGCNHLFKKKVQIQYSGGLPPVSMTLLGYDPSIGGSHMSNQRYRPEFKDEAVRQVVDRGYSVPEVADRIWLVSFMHYDLGYFDHETCRLEPRKNPFEAKVLPMSPV